MGKVPVGVAVSEPFASPRSRGEADGPSTPDLIRGEMSGGEGRPPHGASGRPSPQPSPRTRGEGALTISLPKRRAFQESVADTPTIILLIHFPEPTAGRIMPMSQGFEYEFVM